MSLALIERKRKNSNLKPPARLISKESEDTTETKQTRKRKNNNPENQSTPKNSPTKKLSTLKDVKSVTSPKSGNEMPTPDQSFFDLEEERLSQTQSYLDKSPANSSERRKNKKNTILETPEKISTTDANSKPKEPFKERSMKISQKFDSSSDSELNNENITDKDDETNNDNDSTHENHESSHDKQNSTKVRLQSLKNNKDSTASDKKDHIEHLSDEDTEHNDKNKEDSESNLDTIENHIANDENKEESDTTTSKKVKDTFKDSPARKLHIPIENQQNIDTTDKISKSTDNENDESGKEIKISNDNSKSTDNDNDESEKVSDNNDESDKKINNTDELEKSSNYTNLEENSINNNQNEKETSPSTADEKLSGKLLLPGKAYEQDEKINSIENEMTVNKTPDTPNKRKRGMTQKSAAKDDMSYDQLEIDTKTDIINSNVHSKFSTSSDEISIPLSDEETETTPKKKEENDIDQITKDDDQPAKKKRGRPPKNQNQNNDENQPKKKRGRPPKQNQGTAPNEISSPDNITDKTSHEEKEDEDTKTEDQSAKKKRGRPPKTQNDELRLRKPKSKPKNEPVIKPFTKIPELTTKEFTIEYGSPLRLTETAKARQFIHLNGKGTISVDGRKYFVEQVQENQEHLRLYAAPGVKVAFENTAELEPLRLLELTFV